MLKAAARATLPFTAHAKLFFALSRTPHGLLDMATPAFAALLWLKAFPPIHVMLLGLATAFAGYTAVYALNDLIGCREDRQKMQQGGFSGHGEGYLDAVIVRHPVAGGYLSFTEGMYWAGAWALLALWGAYLLNPVCMYIFIAACILESIYCCLWNISPLRTLVSGLVKTSGPVAAVFAVDARPDAAYVLCLFFVIFLWEIGGQNIPADWTDIEEDTRLHARTVPVTLGCERSGALILVLLISAVAASGLLFLQAGSSKNIFPVVLALATGAYLLLVPALHLNRKKNRLNALALFNRASYYPAALLCISAVMLLI
jgi:4-hydroxybenzoate polyprenyltransferase